jgi:hypothetical protein
LLWGPGPDLEHEEEAHDRSTVSDLISDMNPTLYNEQQSSLALKAADIYAPERLRTQVLYYLVPRIGVMSSDRPTLPAIKSNMIRSCLEHGERSMVVALLDSHRAQYRDRGEGWGCESDARALQETERCLVGMYVLLTQIKIVVSNEGNLGRAHGVFPGNTGSV